METRRLHDIIPEIKDYYTITDKGEIYSDNSGLMKSRNKGNTEYQIINFQLINGKKKTFRVHRLVLMSFKPITNMDNLQVNHIDGNKKNNSLDNLEWCSAKENIHHAIEHNLLKGHKGEKSNFHKLTQEQIDLIFELRKQGLTQQQIANQVSCTRSNISYILNKKTW